MVLGHSTPPSPSARPYSAILSILLLTIVQARSSSARSSSGSIPFLQNLLQLITLQRSLHLLKRHSFIHSWVTFLFTLLLIFMRLPWRLTGKESACQCRRYRRHRLYSCLENSMATVREVEVGHDFATK